jgi:histidinol phosphatase-like enzyme (inositol monophosphatase family)
MDPVSARYHLAKSIARQAGDLTLKYFQTDLFAVNRKQDGSPVTIADQEAESFLRQAILAEFPDDAIVGEEFGIQEGMSGFNWALDPIDGTKSFISGVPLYGTMVAVIDQRDERRHKAIIGAVHMPALNEGIFASTGQGAWHYRGNSVPTKARVRNTAELAQAVVLSSSVEGFRGRNDGTSLEDLAQQVQFARTWGDVYGYLLVATGRADAMIDPEMNVWDAAAVLPIIEEAGGRFTDWNNNPTFKHRDSVGSNGLIHEALLAALRSSARGNQGVVG